MQIGLVPQCPQAHGAVRAETNGRLGAHCGPHRRALMSVELLNNILNCTAVYRSARLMSAATLIPLG